MYCTGKRLALRNLSGSDNWWFATSSSYCPHPIIRFLSVRSAVQKRHQCCLFWQQIKLMESRRQTCVTATVCGSEEQHGHLEDRGIWFWSLRSIPRNCSRPETSQKKQLFLVASTSVLHSPSLCSHYIPVAPSGLPPLMMKKKENIQPGARWTKEKGRERHTYNATCQTACAAPSLCSVWWYYKVCVGLGFCAQH